MLSVGNNHHSLDVGDLEMSDSLTLLSDCTYASGGDCDNEIIIACAVGWEQ